MTVFRSFIIGGLVSVGMIASAPAAHAAPSPGYQYPAPYDGGDLRSTIDRTQNDLRTAADLEHGDLKQQGRYRDAQSHLSNLDKNLVKGHFDKGDFNHAIDDIKSILDHNTLQPSTRDALTRDMSDLKVARDRHY